MRERIFGNWHVLAATLFSVMLIAGVYALGRGIELPSRAQASTESALLQAIATKDVDGDGLPDWEEILYGTSPSTTDTFHLGMTDGEAVIRGLIVPKAIADIPVAGSETSPSGAPSEGTITAAFAKTFFTLYLAAKQASGGADLSESDMNNVANQALQSLSTSFTDAPDFKSAKNLTTSGTGAEALKTFAVQAEAVLMRKSSNATKSEILYLQDAVEKDDVEALLFISSIAKAYRESAVGLAVLPVPEELAGDDLALINALMRTSQIADDFTKVNDDPLATILALQQYPQAVLALGNAFIHIGMIYKAVNFSLPGGAPGSAFVNLMQNIPASQQAAKKP